MIRLEGINKIYNSGAVAVHALCDVDLNVGRGEMVAIMGSSGSGKSTLMNLLGCLDRPTSGKYYLEDQLVSEMDEDELAAVRNRRIGFVFQTFNLLPRMTAQRNVEQPLIYAGVRPAERRQRAAAALQRVGLADRGHHRPAQLSGGQCQRVAVARALVGAPSIVLADEPTGNLDSRTSIEVMALFQALNAEGVTLLIITHEPDIAEHCRRVIEIRDGRIVADRAVARPRQALAPPPEEDAS